MSEAEPEAQGDPATTPEPNYSYGDFHKLVLQGFMAAGSLEAKGVKRLFFGTSGYLGRDVDSHTNMPFVQKVVRDINEKIRKYDMAIRSACCELTGKKYYVYLVTVQRPIMKMQTIFTEYEIALFKRILDGCLRRRTSYSVPLTDCINMGLLVDNKVNVEVAEAFIFRLMDMRYFAKYIFGNDTDAQFDVTLGFRAIREFEPVLRQLYDYAISNCCLCNLILLHGFICPTCKCHVHRPCHSRYTNPREKDKLPVLVCPKCNGPWDVEMIPKTRENQELGDEEGPTPNRALQTQMQLQNLNLGSPGQREEGSEDEGPLMEMDTEELEEVEEQGSAARAELPAASPRRSSSSEANPEVENQSSSDAAEHKAAVDPKKRKVRRGGRQRRGRK